MGLQLQWLLMDDVTCSKPQPVTVRLFYYSLGNYTYGVVIIQTAYIAAHVPVSANLQFW